MEGGIALFINVLEERRVGCQYTLDDCERRELDGAF